MRLVIVSGLSGSGKSVALHMLEDLDYYCVDNIPAGLLPMFISHTVRSHESTYGYTAVGVDARNRPAEIASVPTLVDELKRSGLNCEVLFLRADEEALLKRYSETRRRHPLSREGLGLADAIRQERGAARADRRRRRPHHRHDAHQRARAARADTPARRRPQRRAHVDPVRVVRVPARRAGRCRFRVRRAQPAQSVLGARSRRAHRPRSRRSSNISNAIRSSPRCSPTSSASSSTGFPELVRTNRSYLTIAIGCTGGQHRSVYLVERLAQHFSARYAQVHARHQVVGGHAR